LPAVVSVALALGRVANAQIRASERASGGEAKRVMAYLAAGRV